MKQKEEISMGVENEPPCEELRLKSAQCCANLDQYATKNILVISLCFLLLLLAFNGLQALQSSLHTEGGLGLAAISVLYAVFAASTLLGLAPAVISKIGHKWTMVGSMGAYLLWVLMNGHANWYTMIPAAVLVGLAAGPLWVAKSAYLTITATNVSNQGGESREILTHRYFGVFFFWISSAISIGSAISSSILHVDDGSIAVLNRSSAVDLWGRCGARDCPSNLINETAIEPQDPHKVWLLVGVCGGCVSLAILIMALALDNVTKPAETFTTEQPWQMMSSVLRHHRHRRQLLLIPLCLQQGWALGFIFGEFTKSFGSCVYGVWMVGMVTLPFGVTHPLMSLVAAGLVKYTGRLLLMTAAQIGDLALMITLLCWSGHGGQYVVFILSALMGITEATKKTVFNGTISFLFPENSEIAFCATKFWESVAWIVPFAYSKYLCTSTKIWVLLVVTLFAGCSFVVLEKERCTKKTIYRTVVREEKTADGKIDHNSTCV